MKIYIYHLILLFLFIKISNAQYDDKFYFPIKAWDKMDLTNYEEVSLKKDSIQLSGIFIKTNQPIKATVLYFHGASGNVSKYYPIAKPLTGNGYQVFMIDLEGYGKSTGTPSHLNIASDGQFVFDYLTNRDDVKNTKIILFGASMGTQVATKIARDNQNKISALVLDGTISSFTDIAVFYSPDNMKEFMKDYISPYSAKDDIKYIDKVPKLFIHSEEDTQVPIEEGRMVYDNAKEPKEFWVYKGPHIEAMTLFPEEFIGKLDNMIK